MKQAQSARNKSRARPQSQKRGRGNNNNGNRMENRVRGNPKQLLDKYKTQARDAKQAGEHVQAEYYYQFADHYQRIMNEMRLGVGGVFEEYKPQARRADADDQPEDSFDGDDGHIEPDGEEVAAESGDGDGEEQPRRQRASRSQREQRAQRGDRGDRGERGERGEGRGGDRSRGRRRRPQEPQSGADAAASSGSASGAVEQPASDSQPVESSKPAGSSLEMEPLPFEGAQPDFLSAAPPVSPPVSEPVKKPRGRPRKKPVEADAPAQPTTVASDGEAGDAA